MTERATGEGRGGSHDDIRWSDRKALSDGQANDVYELAQRLPLSRHAWLQELIDTTPEGQRVTTAAALIALLDRMRELTSQPERDMELEVATVEMGLRLGSNPDFGRDIFSYQWVRTNEAYERVVVQPTMDWSEDPSRFPSQGRLSMVPCDIVGIGNIPSSVGLGEDLGYAGENASRWFMTYRAERITVDVPLDAITEVVADRSKVGSIIESPSNRSGPFHQWVQIEAA